MIGDPLAQRDPEQPRDLSFNLAGEPTLTGCYQPIADTISTLKGSAALGTANQHLSPEWLEERLPFGSALGECGSIGAHSLAHGVSPPQFRPLFRCSR